MARQYILSLWTLLGLSLLLAGCVSSDTNPSHLFQTKADYLVISRPVTVSEPVNISAGAFNQAEPAVVTNSQAQAVIAAYRVHKKAPVHSCSLGDRFDRSAELAYDFSDGKSRLALDLDIEGLDWDGLGNFGVEEVMLRYRYRFQKGKTPDERCRHLSPVQGLIGSVYNEIIQREEDTVWEELEDRGAFFWRD